MMVNLTFELCGWCQKEHQGMSMGGGVGGQSWTQTRPNTYDVAWKRREVPSREL